MCLKLFKARPLYLSYTLKKICNVNRENIQFILYFNNYVKFKKYYLGRYLKKNIFQTQFL